MITNKLFISTLLHSQFINGCMVGNGLGFLILMVIAYGTLISIRTKRKKSTSVIKRAA